MVINGMIAEGPDDHHGRRGRKRRGVVLPGLLVLASVLVVVAVIVVSQMLPRDANGQIPTGAGGDTTGVPVNSDDQPQADGSASDSPAASGQPSPSTPGRKPSPSGGVSQAPPQPGGPAPPPVPAPTPPGPSMAPVSVEAEKATLAGGATVGTCATCSGGSTVRKIGAGPTKGSVTVDIPGVPRAGVYQLTMTYELGEPSRTFYLSVNAGAGTPVTVRSNVTDFNTPLTATVSVTLTAGRNTVKFYNPTTSFAPDLDKVTIQ